MAAWISLGTEQKKKDRGSIGVMQSDLYTHRLQQTVTADLQRDLWMRPFHMHLTKLSLKEVHFVLEGLWASCEWQQFQSGLSSQRLEDFPWLTAQVSFTAQVWVYYYSKVWNQNSKGSLQLVLLRFRYSQVLFQRAWQKSQTEKEQLAWWNTFTGSTNRNRTWDSRNQSSHQRLFSADNHHS